MLKRRRRHKSETKIASVTDTAKSGVRASKPVASGETPQGLFEDDLPAQRLFNRAALEDMGEYGAVILASDSLRPAWSEPGDLVHVRRGAEDAAAITTKLRNSR